MGLLAAGGSRSLTILLRRCLSLLSVVSLSVAFSEKRGLGEGVSLEFVVHASSNREVEFPINSDSGEWVLGEDGMFWFGEKYTRSLSALAVSAVTFWSASAVIRGESNAGFCGEEMVFTGRNAGRCFLGLCCIDRC